MSDIVSGEPWYSRIILCPMSLLSIPSHEVSQPQINVKNATKLYSSIRKEYINPSS